MLSFVIPSACGACQRNLVLEVCRVQDVCAALRHDKDKGRVDVSPVGVGDSFRLIALIFWIDERRRNDALLSLDRLAHRADVVGAGGLGVTTLVLAGYLYAHGTLAVKLGTLLYYQLLDHDIAIHKGGLAEDEQVGHLYAAIDTALQVGVFTADVAIYLARSAEHDLALADHIAAYAAIYPDICIRVDLALYHRALA